MVDFAVRGCVSVLALGKDVDRKAARVATGLGDASGSPCMFVKLGTVSQWLGTVLYLPKSASDRAPRGQGGFLKLKGPFPSIQKINNLHGARLSKLSTGSQK